MQKYRARKTGLKWFMWNRLGILGDQKFTFLKCDKAAENTTTLSCANTSILTSEIFVS